MNKKQKLGIEFLMNDLLARASRLEERQDKAMECDDACRLQKLKLREERIMGEFQMAYHILDSLGYEARYHVEEDGREFYKIERKAL